MWQQAAERLYEDPGVCMLWGDTDTGKTTLAAFLASYCVQEGRSVAVVDADVGQSDIGPPGTIGMAFVDGVVARLDSLEAEASYFVGFNSPYGLESVAATGTHIMTEKAKEMGAEVIIVDTTGAVSGRQGRRLKYLKMELLAPKHLIALQRDCELEHLLRPFRRRQTTRITRLPQLPGVRRRSRSERRWLRQQRFARWFARAEKHRLDLNDIALLRTHLHTGCPLLPEDRFHLSQLLGTRVLHAERAADMLFAVTDSEAERKCTDFLKGAYGVSNISLAWAGDFCHLLVGLSSESKYIADIGILLEILWDDNEALVLAAGESAETASELHLGSLKLKRTGTELGRAQSILTYY